MKKGEALHLVPPDLDADNKEPAFTPAERLHALYYLRRVNLLTKSDDDLFFKLLEYGEVGEKIVFSPEEARLIKEYAIAFWNDRMAVPQEVSEDDTTLPYDLTPVAPPLWKKGKVQIARHDGFSKEESKTRAKPIDIDERKIWLNNQLDDWTSEPLTLKQKIALVKSYERQYGEKTTEFREKLVELKAQQAKEAGASNEKVA